MQITLGEICSFTNGGTPKKSVPEYWTGDIPFITGADIDEGNGTITEPRGYITEEAISKSSTNLIPTGSILLVTRTGVGKVAIPPYPVCVSQDFTALSFDPKVVHQRYLFHVLRRAKESFVRQARGATIQGITREVVSSFKFDLPTYSEQERIAAILDKASRVSESVATSSLMKPHIIRSVFLDMFGDMLTNTKDWPIIKLGNACESQLGKAISREAKLCQSPSKYLRNANVQWRKVDITDLKEMDFKPKEKDKLKLRNGDVLATEGGDVGRCAIWSNGNTEIYFQNSLHRIRVDETILTAEYLVEYFAIMSERGGLIRETTQVTIAHLTGQKLKNLPLPLPPLHLQQKFIQKLNQIEKITSNFDLRTNEISQSIQQEMLT